MTAQDLVGTWELRERSFNCTINLWPDGSYAYISKRSVLGMSDTEYSEVGAWCLDGDDIVLETDRRETTAYSSCGVPMEHADERVDRHEKPARAKVRLHDDDHLVIDDPRVDVGGWWIPVSGTDRVFERSTSTWL
jgi:hypothetical protein